LTGTVSFDEDDIMRRAFRAYFRRLGDEPGVQQPSQHSYVHEHKGKYYAVLHNVNGFLAVYRIKPDGFLKLLRRWPKALEE